MIFITTYLTANIDPQRGVKWNPYTDDLEILCQSVKGDITILHDEDIDQIDYSDNQTHGNMTCSPWMVKVKPLGNPYFARWEHIYNNLPSDGFVCLLDATDTEVLRYPTPTDKKTIYVGHEQSIVGCEWMTQNFSTDYLLPFIKKHANKQLLNCGVVIGHVSIIKKFLKEMMSECVKDVGIMEMGIFNKILYEKFANNIEYGNHITTQFKKYETKNKKAWIRHK